MWLLLAFVSATFLGLYDTSKKVALKDNAVLPVLFLNTVFSTLIFSPFIITDISGSEIFAGSVFDPTAYPEGGSLLKAHILVILKAFIVLSSWIAGYFGLKHLPITIVGPINATRPVLVLLGAMFLFGERLNFLQWTGVLLALSSIFLMSYSSKKEQIDFKSNKWIWCVAFATLMGAVSGLYDKFIMKELGAMFVQSWFNLYQMFIMAAICAFLWWPTRKSTTPFHWSWAIPLISLFLAFADFAYLNSLRSPESMISVVSLVRRGSVLISFACGVLIFKERNLKAKAIDLLLILIGMVFMYFGSR